MSDVLIQFVLDNLWCTPGQDQVLTIKPQKVAGPDASFREVQYMERRIPLPNSKDGFYVYQIGTYYQSPDQLPIGHRVWENEKWYLLSEPLQDNNLITYLFTDMGFRFPLFRSYYIYTKEKALLIAVEKNPIIPADLDTEDLYVRFYRNAFYDSERSEDIDYNLQYEGQVLTSASQITAINATIAELTEERGEAFIFINGRFHYKPTPALAPAGSFVEYIYDPTVKGKDRIALDNCPVFESTLDNEEKHLVIPNATYHNSDTIEYLDDTEMYLVSQTGTDSYFGMWIPLVSNKAVRMVTEAGYSIQKSLIDPMEVHIDENNPTTFPHVARIQFHFRHSGYDRPLLGNSSMTQDLKFLTVENIREVMTLTDDEFEPWKAAEMEASAYPQVMSAEKDQVTQQLSEEALGYLGLSESFGHTLTKVTVNGVSRTTPIPETYQAACTGYEYNLTGLMLEFHPVQNQTVYSAGSSSCNAVELFKGTGTVRPSVRCGDGPLVFNAGYSHRVYACPKISGNPTFSWVDITDTDDYVIDYDNNTIDFSNPSDPRFMMVRDDSTFIIQDEAPIWSDGVMMFTLKEEIDRGVGVAFEYLDMQVPGTDLAVVLNQKSLVRNIDFFVKFPYVFITNYSHLRHPVASSYQNLHARTLGLGNGVTEFGPVFHKGQVTHGMVGGGSEYVPHYDKPLRIVIDGNVKQVETTKFVQDNPEVNDPTNVNNGRVYQVQPYPVPVGHLTLNGEALREVYRIEQPALVEFMEGYYTPPTLGSETLAAAYVLVCPFYSRIIRDLVTDTITPSETNPGNTDGQIQTTIAEYEWLLEVSPCNPDNGLRTSRYSLRPHPYESVFSIGSAQKLNFLQRVLNLYTPGAFTLGTYVVV